jgi:hypothetical protein
MGIEIKDTAMSNAQSKEEYHSEPVSGLTFKKNEGGVRSNSETSANNAGQALRISGRRSSALPMGFTGDISGSLRKESHTPNRDRDDSFDWIQEEELLLNLSESNSFDLAPLDKIVITFLYVDRTQDVVDVIDAEIDISSESADKSIVKKNVIKWDELKRIIDEHKVIHGLRYLFNDAAYYHASISYDQLDSFHPSTTLTAIERDKDLKLSSTLPVFHDLSQIFVIMREATCISIGKSLKSILRSGAKIGKTKKVRISEASAEIISSSRKTRKTT